MADEDVTTFKEMYDVFLSHVTDDMYMEMTKEDTDQMLEEILVSAMSSFEFPHWECRDVLDMDNKCFCVKLTHDEEEIIANGMVAVWIGFQLANVDVIRQKYSTSDYSLTSQASHAKQLQNLKEHYEQRMFHLQRLYSRKEYDGKGRARSSFYKLAQVKRNPGRGWEDR